MPFGVHLKKKYSKIPKGQTEIFQLKDIQDHSQENNMKADIVGTTKLGINQTLQIQGSVQVVQRGRIFLL